MSIQMLRGPSSRLNTITPGTGEPLWVTDTFEFRVGDGTTVGGRTLQFVKYSGTPTLDQVALWVNATTIKGQDKATFLAGYATTTYVDNGLSGKLDTGGTAANSNALGGTAASGYLTTSLRSTSVTSTSTTNVATSSAVKTANDNANSAGSLAASKIGAANYASSTTGGTLKIRQSGTTLYITNNGSNA